MKKDLQHYHTDEVKINNSIRNYFRAVEFVPTESINVMRIGEDIILTNGEVPEHTDNTVEGKDTVMLIINADNCIFNHNNSKVALKSGDIIRFDGNKPHSLNYISDEMASNFCAIIWDVELEVGIDDLIYDFEIRLQEICKQIS